MIGTADHRRIRRGRLSRPREGRSPQPLHAEHLRHPSPPP
jgi:hypothetical protein